MQKNNIYIYHRRILTITHIIATCHTRRLPLGCPSTRYLFLWSLQRLLITSLFLTALLTIRMVVEVKAIEILYQENKNSILCDYHLFLPSLLLHLSSRSFFSSSSSFIVTFLFTAGSINFMLPSDLSTDIFFVPSLS